MIAQILVLRGDRNRDTTRTVIVAVFFIVVLSLILRSLVVAYHLRGLNEDVFTVRVTVFVILLVLIIMDFVLTTIFIVGGHKKNLKMLTIYYYYSIGVWILSILFSIFIVSMYFNAAGFVYEPIYAWVMSIMESSSHFISMVAQGYFLLLLRSEMLKLRNNCEFRFVNNAAQPECELKCNKEKDTPCDNNGTGCKGACHKVISDV
ncbi:unnamed protein product [Chrysodeixis includens]|uniref:Uncharacterized protein n=1 Tax=Chrysodeixis includens TaxID=689277 RepID=A0A9N8KZC5_CHRIL|nr:unnamed protein product [Chrysodeixis includens]